MAEGIKGKAQEVGHKIAETAQKVGNKISETTEKATDWAKEKLHAAGNRVDEAKQKAGHKIDEMKGSESGCCGAKSDSTIQEHMDVIASCGKKVGVVDHVEDNSIKLTKNDSADGKHHLIPKGWVDHVDTHVHLKKNSAETEREWQAV